MPVTSEPGWRLDFLVSSRLGGGGDRLPHSPRGSAPGSSAVPCWIRFCAYTAPQCQIRV